MLNFRLSRRAPWSHRLVTSKGVLGIALLAGFCLLMAAYVADDLTGVTG